MSPSKISIPTGKGIRIIKTNDILYCQANGRYTRIYLQSGETFLISKVLKEYEELLCSNTFYRIHKSYLINLNEVKEYLFQNNHKVILNNNMELSVSQRKSGDFRKKILEQFAPNR